MAAILGNRDRIRTLGLWCVLACLAPPPLHAQTDRQQAAWEDVFESQIRPLLAQHCHECHGPRRQSGGLRLDSREFAVRGGDSGPAIVPGRPDDSLLIQAVRREDGLEMPPESPLPAAAPRLLAKWIAAGAAWPADAAPAERSIADRSREHWAFQPIARPEPPQVDGVSHPIDAFVVAARQRAGLTGSPPAAPRTLVRRASYALTGLPPKESWLKQFAQLGDSDDVDAAYARWIDTLLESPAFGEHWARLWLDVARYSDTKGYVYAREERFWIHAWSYRDWVVRALNEDMPYDRFLMLQIAADQMPDCRESDLAAMGFLTIGRRFLGVQHDIIDDRIDVVTRGALGLTVSCARCHDHKFDAIPTADYYSLYGVFASCRQTRLPLPSPVAAADAAFQAELNKRQQALAEKMAAARKESSDRVRRRIADYLFAQSELEKYPPPGFDQVFEADDMLPAFVRRWQAYLHRQEAVGNSVFILWHAFLDLHQELGGEEPQYPADRVAQLLETTRAAAHPLVHAALKANPPTTLADVAQQYQKLFEQALQQENAPPNRDADDAEWTALRSVLFGPDSPCEPPPGDIVDTETYFRTADCTALWKLQGEVDRWIRQSPYAPFTLGLTDRERPVTPRVFQRGNPLRLGQETSRHFLTLMTNGKAQPFQQGSGRLELAQAIASSDNPLTARVIVNRIWARYFGAGLVEQASDFGLRSPPPSHPQLLDYLAQQLMDHGWRMKPLHRLIVTSQTFRQSSRGPGSQESPGLARAQQQDPLNRLLWRMKPRRLGFEALRDSLLHSSGSLSDQIGGKPETLFQPPYTQRRTLYGLVDRQFLPSTYRIFDFASPDLHVAKRSQTTVPQQSLFFMNHPFVLHQAKLLASQCVPMDQPSPTGADVIAGLTAAQAESTIQQMFHRTLQRAATEQEVQEACRLLRHAAAVELSSTPATADDWAYGLGQVNEELERVEAFESLPHFTGDAWQGAAAWPDPKFGWTQLTAAGGHPGNTRAHGCVRRWQAPRDVTVRIESTFQHEPAAGDGVRVFIVRHGPDAKMPGKVLLADKFQQRSADLNVDPLEVKAGAWIDFVVDIDEVLNSDQFLWEITIESASDGTRWNSRQDFPRNEAQRLSAWEQLAHVLFCSNEFLFVD